MTDAQVNAAISRYYDHDPAEIGARFCCVNIERGVCGLPFLDFNVLRFDEMKLHASLMAALERAR